MYLAPELRRLTCFAVAEGSVVDGGCGFDPTGCRGGGDDERTTGTVCASGLTASAVVYKLRLRAGMGGGP